MTNELTNKGLQFAANNNKTGVTNKLGSKVSVVGADKKDGHEYTSDNLTTEITQGEDGNTTIKVLMDKDITADKVTVGKNGADGKDGHIGVAGKDGERGVGIDGKDGISVKGKDGKDGVTIKGIDGENGTEGQIGLTGPAGKDGTSTHADIGVNAGPASLVAEKNLSETEMTRIHYTDEKGDHQVATMDDGLKFAGDDGQNDASKVISKTLNNTMDIVGGATGTLTDGNIGVNNVGGKLKVQLAKDLNGISSITNGETSITLNETTKEVNVGGAQITNVASGGTTVTNAANIGDVNSAITNVTNELTNKGLQFAANDNKTGVTNKLGSKVSVVGADKKDGHEYTSDNLTTEITQGEDGNTTIKVLMDKDITADKVTVGKNGADGKDGHIGVAGKDGERGVGIDGKDGISVKGKDGKDGVTIKGIDGENGTEGQIGLTGPAGKDGTSTHADIGVNAGPASLVAEKNLSETEMTRIHYTDEKGDHQVATMDDGLKFAGDDGQNDASKVISKTLNNTMDIVGGATGTLTDGNIGVNNVGGKLKVQLSKDVNLTPEGSVELGRTIVTSTGIKIRSLKEYNRTHQAPPRQDGDPEPTTVELKDDGLYNGYYTIRQVKSALGDTNLDDVNEEQKYSAATVADLQRLNKTINEKSEGELRFDANSGGEVTNKSRSKVTIAGAGTEEDERYDGGNLKTYISQDEDGNTTIKLMMAKNAQFESVKAGNTMMDTHGITIHNEDGKPDVSLTGNGLDNGGNRIVNVAAGKNDTDAVNVKQLKDVVNQSVEGAKAKSGKNITVDNNGKVNLNDSITMGSDDDPTKQVKIDGEKASITAGSGANQVSLDGLQGKVTAGKVTVNGSSGTVNGLTNLTWDAEHITSGQAATEDQLKQAVGNIQNLSEDAGKHSSVTAGDNITVTEDGTNEKGGVVYKVATSKDLSVNSVTTGSTRVDTHGVTIENGPSITNNGIDAGGKVVTNVENGRVAPDSKDAVNGSQLYDTQKAINNVGSGINKLSTRINRVGASAAALAALHPQDFDPDDKLDFAAGYGNYKSTSAVAIGAFYRPTENVMFSVGGSFSGGENMVNAGVTWKLGQKNHVTRSRVALAKDVLAMKQELESLKKELAAYKAGGQPNVATTAARTVNFPDVPENHWAYNYVKSLAERGYLEGYPDGEFKGDRTMTRYEYAAIIYRALQNGAPSDGNMARSIDEFGPELTSVQSIDRFRVDRISGKDNDRNKVERVRVNDKDNAAKNDYRDVYGSQISR